jgi:hypothetical protein
MIGRRSVIGLSLLCALAVCAFAASGASAAGGLTLVTCKKGGTTLDFKANAAGESHCSSTDKVALKAGTYSHFRVANGVPTTITGSNAKTTNETKEAVPAELEGVVAGVVLKVKCTTVSSSGTTENTEPSAETHKIVVSGVVITYSGCTVPTPPEQECKVTGGTFSTNSLKAESVEDNLKFVPTTGSVFASIPISGCKTAALNGSKEVKGSVVATPNGATLTVNIVRNAESTLEFGGQKAGLKLVETVRGKKVGGAEAAEPLSTTTTPLVVSE